MESKVEILLDHVQKLHKALEATVLEVDVKVCGKINFLLDIERKREEEFQALKRVAEETATVLPFPQVSEMEDLGAGAYIETCKFYNNE